LEFAYDAANRKTSEARYADLAATVRDAFAAYAHDVRAATFPTDAQSVRGGERLERFPERDT